MFELRAAQVINPDPAHVGGISEMVRIGHWAEAYDVALAPHCPLGPIALAACLQVDAICHNAFIQEQSLGIHYNQGGDLLDYVKPGRLPLEDGHLQIPQGPGLGIEVDRGAGEEMAAHRPPLARAGLAPQGRVHRGMVRRFPGIHAVLFALFDAEERLDRAAMAAQMAYVRGHGAEGVVILGLATEVGKLSEAEKRTLIDWAAADRGDLPLGVTITGNSVAEQRALAAHAVGAGADWLILQPPLAGSYGAGEYLDFFARVGGDLAVPFAVQNAPQYLGRSLSPPTSPHSASAARASPM